MNYSYNKLLLIKGPVIGILVLILGFITSIILPNLLTFEHFINKADYYKKNIKKITCMSKEKQENIGFLWLKKIIKNLNTYFTFGQHKITNYVCDSMVFASIDFFGIDINLIKLYMILLGSSSSLLLMKIVTNYAINMTISTTITPKEDDDNKPNTFLLSLKMIGYYLFNLLIITIPIIFTYCAFGHGFFDISNWREIWDNFDTFAHRMKNVGKSKKKGPFTYINNLFEKIGYISHKSFEIILLIIKVIIVMIIMIIPLIYIFYSLNLFNIPIIDKYIGSVKNICSSFLKPYFNSIDTQYIENIYNFKDNILMNWGIWFMIFFVLFIIHYNMVNTIKNNYNKLFYLLIFISIFTFIFYIVYKEYTFGNQNIFDENGELSEQITKSHTNNLLQTIVKYGYSCVV